jgi:hypothetical protein
MRVGAEFGMEFRIKNPKNRIAWSLLPPCRLDVEGCFWWMRLGLRAGVGVEAEHQ